LAFVLLCSVFFSLLLIDALVISGQERPQPIPLAIVTLAITAATSITLVYMWYRGKPERGIACWAVVTLLLLVFAPGGPFVEGATEGVAGLNLWVPVLVLVFLASTTWLYEIGNPVDKTLPLARRVVVVCVLIAITVVATLSLGSQLQRAVIEDEKTPDISSPGAQSVIDQVARWNVPQLRALYGALSEVHLLDMYRRYEKQAGADSYDFGAAGQSETLRERQAITAISLLLRAELGISSGNALNLSRSILTQIKQQGADERALIQFLQNSGIAQINAQNLAPQIIEIMEERSNFAWRADRLNQILDYFDALDTNEQKHYLASRLRWVHAVGLSKQDQSPIALPGLTADERFEKIAHDRIRHALARQSSERTALLAQFNYDKDVVDEFTDDSSLTTIAPLALLSKYGEVPNIFPDLTTDDASSAFAQQLERQLCLPLPTESYLAFREYEIAAHDVVRAKLNDLELATTATDAILKSVNSLSPKSKEAFRYYLFDHKDKDSNYQAILWLRSLDLSPIVDSDDPEAAKRLAKMIYSTDPISDTDPLAGIARSLRAIEQRPTKDAIYNLLLSQDLSISINNLLDEKVFSLLKLVEGPLSDAQKQVVFDYIRDPIKLVVSDMTAQRFIENLPSDEGLRVVDSFSNLDPRAQKGWLHYTAISLYRTEGQYSHNIFNLMVWQANVQNPGAGLLVASLLNSPAVLASLILAFIAARRLMVRDRLRNLMMSEAGQQTSKNYMLGTTDVIRGRDSVITQLKHLAGRGWSAIAVVGRRGVGKTRVLYELMRAARGETRPQAITAWLATPNKFDEAEFVESVLERLTADVENTIARCLGAKPLEVRRLETNSLYIGLSIYGAFVVILAVIFSLMSARVASSHTVGTWFPIFIVFAASVVILLTHMMQIQPVDLTPWLERDRSHSPHTVLLYREARLVRGFLDERRKALLGRVNESRVYDYFRAFAILLAGGIFLVALVSALTAPTTSSRTSNLVLTAVTGVLCFGLIIYRPSRPKVIGGYSLMSLISAYREFVEKTVYRVKMGALGDRTIDDFEVVICIDELDKIVEPEELRTFLRRMKVIFEIPGAYYYLSLSEDGLKALYLGAAEGKNEIDSAFDHIIRVPPVSCDLGEAIARSYLDKHLGSREPSRLERGLAAISYGVPRDIVRRCDELLATGDGTDTKPWSAVDAQRQRQADLAYREQLLTKAELLELSGDAHTAAIAAHAFLTTRTADSRSGRVVLSLWVLALLAMVINQSEEQWRALSEQLRDIGYRIIDERTEQLVDELNGIHTIILPV
jgi:hypothetical protein